MAAPIDLRNDFDSVSLRRLAKRTRDATQSSAGVGRSRLRWRIGGVGLEIIRGSTPDGHRAHPRSSTPICAWRRFRPPGPGGRRRRALAAQMALGVRSSTRPRSGAIEGARRAKISARPRHYAQNDSVALKKNFPAELAKIRARLPKGVEIELWWQDEARIGQKNKLTRRWARRGTRPRAPRQVATSAPNGPISFGDLSREGERRRAGHGRADADGGACRRHRPAPIASIRPVGRLTPKLAIPDNITVLALPPRSPELNLAIHADNWLSNRIFKSYAIVALCCQAWNNLIDQPWKIMSLGMPKWAHGF